MIKSQLETPDNSEGYLLTDKRRKSADYFVNKLNRSISRIHRNSRDSRARDLAEGKMTEHQFEYLENVFGIETPHKVQSINIIRPRCNALIGAMIDEEIHYTINCSDARTLEKETGEREGGFKSSIEEMVDDFVHTELSSLETVQDSGTRIFSEERLKSLQYKFSNKYTSSYREAATYLIEHFKRDATIALLPKLDHLGRDLVTIGRAVYKVSAVRLGADPELTVFKPENTCFTKSSDGEYSECAVVMYWTRGEVFSRLGHYMSAKDMEHFNSVMPLVNSGHRFTSEVIDTRALAEGSYYEDNGEYFATDDIIKVHHVEFKEYVKIQLSEADKEDLTLHEEGKWDKIQNYSIREDLYEGWRIDDMFLGMGKKKHVVRSNSNPLKCSLSYSEVRVDTRNNSVQSIPRELEEIQNMYNLAHFHKNNLLAASSGPISRINIAAIPLELGDHFMERLLKFIQIRKVSNVELINPTLPGAKDFAQYGEAKGGVAADVIMSFESIFQTLERQADILAGTNPQMLAQIAQKDAVSNVKVGMHQTTIINKSLHLTFRTMVGSILLSLLDTSKMTLKAGKQGTIKMGAFMTSFSVAPESFRFSDHALHITDDSKDNLKLATIRDLAKGLATSGLVPPEVLLLTAASNSIDYIIRTVNDAVEKQRSENMQQQTQQLEEAKKQAETLNKELESLKNKTTNDNKAESAAKTKEIEAKIVALQAKTKLDSDTLKQRTEHDAEIIELKKVVTQLEREQLYLSVQGGSNGNSAEIRNDI